METSTDELSSEENCRSSVMESQHRQLDPTRKFLTQNSLQWWQDPAFNQYWKHYQMLHNWYQKHEETVRQNRNTHAMTNSAHSYWAMAQWGYIAHMMQSYCSMFQWSPYGHYSGQFGGSSGQNTGPYSTFKHSVCSQTKNAQRSSVSKKRSQKSKKSSKVKRRKKRLSVGTDENFEMEISEEMLQFFAHSAKHKKELEARRQLEAEESEEEHVNVELANRKVTSCLPPTERPGVRRTAEMKQLYGRSAAMIHGMETAMQLTFDRNCDIKQPKLWPSMPLNMKFN